MTNDIAFSTIRILGKANDGLRFDKQTKREETLVFLAGGVAIFPPDALAFPPPPLLTKALEIQEQEKLSVPRGSLILLDLG